MTTKHTPMPWVHLNGSVWSNSPSIDKSQRTNMVCSISPQWKMPDSEKKANEFLLAAAPDLLAACEHAANVFRAEIRDIDPRNELSRNDTPELAAAWHNLEIMETSISKATNGK